MDFLEYDHKLREADKAWNSMVMCQVLVDIQHEDRSLTFATAEKRLRELGSNTYLIANPAKNAPPGIAVRYHLTGELTTHSLWVCLHGKEEAVETMRQFDIPTAEQNMIWLRDCGVLMMMEPG